MSVSIIDIINSECDYQNQKNIYLAVLVCDTVSDLPQKEYSANITLAQGSKSKVIETGKDYLMQSDGTWVEQPSEHINSGDYYDKTEVDSAIAAETSAREAADLILQNGINVRIVYGTGTELAATAENPIDMNDLTTVGTYFATSDDLLNITNAPFAPTGALNPIRVDVIALASGRRQQIARATGSSGDIFIRNNISSGWGPWFNLNRLGLPQAIASTTDLNDYQTPGSYYCNATVSSTLSNNPATGSPIKLEVEYLNGTNRLIQTLTPAINGPFQFYKRQYTSSGWQSWYVFQGMTISSTNSISNLQLNSLNEINERLDLNDDE